MKRILVLSSVFIVLIALFIAAVFSIDLGELWDGISRMGIWWIVLYIIIGFVNFALFVLRWDTIAHAGKDKQISFWDMMGIRYVTYAVSYLVPSAQVGGEPFRIGFLEENGFSRKKALSSVIIDKVFEAAIIVIFSIIAFFLVVFYSHGVPTETYSFFMLFGVLLLFFIYFYLTIVSDGFFTNLFRLLRLGKLRFLKSYEEKIMAMEALIKKFFNHHIKELLITIFVTFLTYILFLLEYYVLLIALGVKPTMGQLIVVSTLPMASYLIPIPGAAGALELSQWAALDFAGFNANSLTAPVIVILRLRDMLFILVGFLYASRHGIKMLTKQTDEPGIER